MRGQDGKRRAKFKEDRVGREPVWVPEDTAEPLLLPALRLSPENRRCLDAAAAFSQLLMTCSQKLSNSISQINANTSSVFCQIHTLKIDSCGVHSELGVRIHIQFPPLPCTHCVALGKSLNLSDPGFLCIRRC